MKKNIVLLLLLVQLFSMTVHSQNLNRNQLLRQRIELAKLRQIRQNLRLDEATFVQFRPLYLKFERNIANLDFKSQDKIMKVKADSMSVQDADLLVLAQWARAKKLLQVREQAYTEFRKILTAQQLVKLYQCETEIRQKVMSELRKRKKQTL